MSSTVRTRQARTVKRYGLRLIAFLGVGFVALALSTAQHHYTTVSLALLLIGLGGAGWNTARGMAAMYHVPPDQRTRGHVEDRNC
jgi:hypothetical protein